MSDEPDLVVRIDDHGDTAVRIVGNQVLDLAGAAAGDLVVVGAGETLDTRTLVDGDIPSAIARDAEVSSAVAAEAAARDAAIAAALAPIWLPANSFSGVTGSPAVANANSNTPWYAMDAASIEAIARTVMIPSSWATTKVELLWANAAAGAGDVVWRLNSLSAGTGESVETAANSGDSTVTAGAQYIVVRTTLNAGLAYTPGEINLVKIQRRASDAADTLANDAGILGVLLTKAS